MTDYAASCGLCERPTAAYLCHGCAEALSGHLEVLPGLFQQLQEFLEPVTRREGRGCKAVEAPVPVDLDVVDLRTKFADVVTGWHGALFEALGWDPPAPAADVTERVKLAVQALRVNTLWIASSWEAAGDFAGEIRDLHRSASSVVDPREHGTRLGLCPAANDGVLCGAVLWLPPGGQVVTCRWCGSRFPPATWVALRLAQEAVTVPALDGS
jgi:hypothetical protein